MSFSVGIVGLPNVGKSTLFKALTKKEVAISPRPFTTINPNVGIVQVPDQRLTAIAEVINPQKITPTTIEFVDIAGLIKGAHKGEGLGNQFLSHIRKCDAILEVVRIFDNPKVENVLGEINPEKEIEVIKLELLMKDLETLNNLIPKLEKEGEKKDLKRTEILKKIKNNVSKGKLISKIELDDQEKKEIKDYQFLTTKPIIYLFNTNYKVSLNSQILHLELNLKDEEDIAELSEDEKQELEMKSHLDQIITSCYNTLKLITFFTIKGGEETRAWTVRQNSNIKTAGGVVHSDFEEKFIRAEVIPWQKLVDANSWAQARSKGWIQTAGKNYIVQDGDVIEFKI